jgi:HK97 family phage major capsid protein
MIFWRRRKQLLANFIFMDEKITLTKKELTDLLAEVSEKAATKAVEAKVKELGVGAVRKFGTFNGSIADMSDEAIAKLSAKEKSAQFFKAVFHKDASALGKFKSMNEGTGSAGGFIVPEEFAAEVNRVVEDFGLVPKFARKFPMKYDTLNVPRLSASVSVYYPGETSAGTASQPTFEQVILLAKTCVGITPMSNEMLADANISVVDLLTELFAEAIAGTLDSQGFAGTGSPFTGILTDAGVTVVQPANGTSNTTFATCATPDNCRDLISNVKPWALQGAGYIMHRTVWAIIQKSKASTAGDYFISAANPVLGSNSGTQGFPNAMGGTLWGYPVWLSDKMPTTTAVSTKFIIFGNLKHLYMGVRAEMGVAISDSATIGTDNLFAQNMSGVRVITRHALAVGLPTAFAVLKTSAS